MAKNQDEKGLNQSEDARENFNWGQGNCEIREEIVW